MDANALAPEAPFLQQGGGAQQRYEEIRVIALADGDVSAFVALGMLSIMRGIVPRCLSRRRASQRCGSFSLKTLVAQLGIVMQSTGPVVVRVQHEEANQ